MPFNEVNLWVFTTAYHRLDIQLDSWPLLSKKIFENVKYVAVTSKYQIFKAWPDRDLNLGLPSESLNIGKLTHVGGPGSNLSQAELWRLVTLKPLKLQHYTLHFWKLPVFIYLDKEDHKRICVFGSWYAILNDTRFISWNCKKVYP